MPRRPPNIAVNCSKAVLSETMEALLPVSIWYTPIPGTSGSRKLSVASGPHSPESRYSQGQTRSFRLPLSSHRFAVSPSPEPSPAAGGGLVAPTSAEGFALRKTVIDISFPIAPSVKYRYKDDFLIPRVGVTHRYNHARGVSASGRLLRAHDGIDIRVDLRTRLLATFSGTVIDPATRWKPWDPERYGNVVVIVSDEPSSVGYAALYAHLSSSRVEVGDHVERGQVIGRVGTTGNAAGLRPHVHFELRAPFRIPVREGGRIRRIDAFGPYPSLVAADPKRLD